MIDRRKLGVLLWPLSFLYRVVVTIRNILFDAGILKSEKFDIATISVGNITVGGTGKTPHIEYLVRLLSETFNLAVLSRGYKRKSKGFIMADLQSEAREIGDEPRQIKNKFPDISVVVDANRSEGIKKIQQLGEENKKPYHLVLLDDAYQHRHVLPGLSILLIDYNRPIDEDHMMPLGNLREPQFSKHRANFIVVSKCPENLKPIECRLLSHRFKVYPHQKLFFTTLKYAAIQDVYRPEETMPNEALNDYSILLVTGIAEPQLLETHLKGLAREVKALSFGDHHFYTKADVEKIKKAYEAIDAEKKIIVSTEKDATRMRELSDFREHFENNLYYIPVKVEFLYEGKEQFDEKILNYVKRNKRNIQLFKK